MVPFLIIKNRFQNVPYVQELEFNNVCRRNLKLSAGARIFNFKSPTGDVSSSWMERLVVKLDLPTRPPIFGGPPATTGPPGDDSLGLLRAACPFSGAPVPAELGALAADRLSIDPPSPDLFWLEPMTVVFACLQFLRRAELERRPFLHICCCNQKE